MRCAERITGGLLTQGNVYASPLNPASLGLSEGDVQVYNPGRVFVGPESTPLRFAPVVFAVHIDFTNGAVSHAEM